MKKIFLAFLIFLFYDLLIAQPNDCCGALEVTSNAQISFPQLNGAGKLETVSDCSCLPDNEHSSFWIKFDCLEDSDLSFAVRSLTGSGDFDYALFLGGCPCKNSQPINAISCDDTDGTGPPFGPTGMGNPAQFGYPGATQFQPSIPMLKGMTFILMIDNKTRRTL